MTNRLDTLIHQLKQHNLDSAFVTSKANVYYLSQYYTDPHERLVAVYVSQSHDPVLIVPAMEENDAKEAGWSFDIISYHDHENVWELFANYLKKANAIPQTIGVEHNHFTLDRYETLTQTFPSIQVTDITHMLANMRVIKNQEEYHLLKQAAELADFGVKTGVEAIKEGVSELEIMATVEYELKKQGIQEMAFATTVLSGPKTASPHGIPGQRTIQKGDFVLFDLGVVYEGYCSDITRTVVFHTASYEQKQIYETVLAAEEKAIEASNNEVPVGKIDRIARGHIEQAGYGQYFTHRIGHGLGIDVHEYPSMHSDNELPLQKGMCFTIEPGIYVPNVGGVRIEDMVFMTKEGAMPLTAYPKKLQIID